MRLKLSFLEFFLNVSFPRSAVGASGPFVPSQMGRDTVQVLFREWGWRFVRQPRAVSRLSVDPTGNLWGLAGAPVLQGREHIPKLVCTQLPAHKVLLVDFHS